MQLLFFFKQIGSLPDSADEFVLDSCDESEDDLDMGNLSKLIGNTLIWLDDDRNSFTSKF